MLQLATPYVAPVIWMALGGLGALGLLALVSPSRFAAVASRGSRWVDTESLLHALDRRVEVDSVVLPYSRWLGAAVLLAVGLLVVLLSR